MKVLCVEDDHAQLKLIREAISGLKHQVVECDTGTKAVQLAAEEALACDAAVLDQNLGENLTGVDVGRSLRSKNPRIFLIMLTAYGTVEATLEAMKADFDDYLTKPLDPEALEKALRLAEKGVGYCRTNDAVLKILLNRPQPKQGLYGEHPVFLQAVREVAAAGSTDARILLLDETGTGKDLFARLIHSCNDTRKAQPFVVVNCPAIPETLLESEIFGHEKGSFTGAQTRKLGKVELANKGTLFLDEIGDMSPPLQAKMLRFLQDGSFSRVGGVVTLTANVRLISATNKNLREKMEKGEFREDLFHRLSVFEVSLPPLRKRASDIPILSNRFLAEFAAKQGGKPRIFASKALDALCAYHWPGNVRELHNQVERATILAKGKDQISPNHLSLGSSSKVGTLSKNESKSFATTSPSQDTRTPYCKTLIAERLDWLESAFSEALKNVQTRQQKDAKKKVRQVDLAEVLKCSHPMVGVVFRDTAKWKDMTGPERIEIIRGLSKEFPQRWKG